SHHEAVSGAVFSLVSPSRSRTRSQSRGGGATAGTSSASSASLHSHSRIAAATTGSARAILARRARARRVSVPSAYSAARMSRRSERSGRPRFIAPPSFVDPHRFEAFLQALQPTPHPRFHRAERLAELLRQLAMRKSLEERQRDGLL